MYHLFKGIKFHSVNMNQTVDIILSYLENYDKSNYICMNDVGNIVDAFRKNDRLKIAIDDSYLSIPDGRPLYLFARLVGDKNIKRVAAPDLLENLFCLSNKNNIKHYFLGDTVSTHQKLKDKIGKLYPNAEIVGSSSPPFRDWSTIENLKIISIASE